MLVLLFYVLNFLTEALTQSEGASGLPSSTHVSGVPYVPTPIPRCAQPAICPMIIKTCPAACPDLCYINVSNPCCPNEGIVYCPGSDAAIPSEATGTLGSITQGLTPSAIPTADTSSASSDISASFSASASASTSVLSSSPVTRSINGSPSASASGSGGNRCASHGVGEMTLAGIVGLTVLFAW
ncbi:hypothetical protein BZG36_00510 [Bifiguratus adelaidae]|uniref:Uncharacterized protein n=1 Tax=Bifiguratus adelaidae TaxID=1938954 RepID=A0A261Y735_9FUNG|nr:hypothetical protein BZG36_00510 [Bifiguratus adelaidae]